MEFNLLGCKLCENYELRFVEGHLSGVVAHEFICCVLERFTDTRAAMLEVAVATGPI